MTSWDEKIKRFLKKNFLTENQLVVRYTLCFLENAPSLSLPLAKKILEGSLKSLHRKSGDRLFLARKTAHALKDTLARNLKNLFHAFV